LRNAHAEGPSRLARELLDLHDQLHATSHPGAEDVKYALFDHCFNWYGTQESLPQIRGVVLGAAH
jgi:hypothetical protein